MITGVRELTNTVEGLRVQYSPEAKPPVDDYVAENVSPKDLEAKYGLGPKPATLRIEGEVGAGSALRRQEERQDRQGRPADRQQGRRQGREVLRPPGERDQRRPRGSAKGVEPLLEIVQNPGTLREKDLVKVGDESKIDAIDIVNPSRHHPPAPAVPVAAWKIVEDGGKLRNADEQAVRALIGMLTLRRQVKAFPTEPDAELGFDDKDAIVVSLWEDGIASNKDKKDARWS